MSKIMLRAPLKASIPGQQLFRRCAFALMLASVAMAGVAQAGERVEREQTTRPLAIKLQQQYGIETPRRGEAKSSVKSRFGEPESRRSPVGDPPITRWKYPQFEVVFEHDWVIHSVVDLEALEQDR